MVFGELLERPVPEQIGPGVPDVGDVGLGSLRHQSRERGTHPVEIAVGLGPLEDPSVGVPDALDQQGRRRLVVLGAAPPGGFDHRLGVRLQRLQGDGRCHVAAPVATHAVGHREQGLPEQVGVLVALASPADVGSGADPDPHRLNSRVVFPMRTRSPG